MAGGVDHTATPAGTVPGAIYDHKYSTVVPSSVTGDVTRELTGMDMAMRLHYIRGVYYYKQSEAIDALDVIQLKTQMSPWLDMHSAAGGRIRFHPDGSDGQPFVKCNDSGIRIVEAKCDMTLEEWLRVEEISRERHLVPDKLLGPDLHLSPLVYIQFTVFKCGGMAIGVSWTHLLGDVVSITNSINRWGSMLHNGKQFAAADHLRMNGRTVKTNHMNEKAATPTKMCSAKIVEGVGDCWVTPNSCKLGTFSFVISEANLGSFRTRSDRVVGSFELISALIWKCVAKIRAGKETNMATICKHDPAPRDGKKDTVGDVFRNEIKISYVRSDVSPWKLEITELALLIHDEAKDETDVVGGMVEEGREGKPQNIVVYGKNLTFVDMEAADIYGLEVGRQRPVGVGYWIDGVDDGGAVAVMRGGSAGTDHDGSRRVVLNMPEWEIKRLIEMIRDDCGVHVSIA